jgi:ankyrin repeat protein
LLLQGGANPKATTLETGETALHGCLSKPGDEAFERDRFRLVKLLLEAGADPNHRTAPGVETLAFWRDTRTRGETPLHRAAAYAAEDTIRLLLSAGADKTIRDANGDSPQSWASWHWRTRELVLLLGS